MTNEADLRAVPADALPPLWKIPLFGGFPATRGKRAR